MRFWDSSAVIPLCVSERSSDAARVLAEEDGHLVVWWGTPIECLSALSRLRRDGVFTERDEDTVAGTLSLLAEAWTEVAPVEQVRRAAARLLRLHPLRAADALQLGAALTWTGHLPSGHGFVCFDQRLRDAARKEGFAVLPADPPGP
jgi:predicted nucleic acid-binding protein